MEDPRASALQFRYLFVTDAEGLKVFDATQPKNIKPVSGAHIALKNPKKLYVARTYAYVAAGSEGLAIINVKNPEQPKLYKLFNANGKINDARDVIVGTTNASFSHM